MSQIDDKDWDLVDLVVHQCDGTFISGQAVLCDLDGRHERLNFTFVRGDDEPAVFPEPYNTLSAVEWIHTHGMADFLSDLREELDVVRDRNRDRDTMGKLIGFVFKERS